MGSGGNLPVGPGFWGFVAFFVMAIALWLLVRNMSSRLRRMAYRERERQGDHVGGPLDGAAAGMGGAAPASDADTVLEPVVDNVADTLVTEAPRPDHGEDTPPRPNVP